MKLKDALGFNENLYSGVNKQESIKAEKYVSDLVKMYKTSKKVRQAILDNLVNSPEYASTTYITAVWAAYNEKFPS